MTCLPINELSGNNSNCCEETLLSIAAMCQQEETGYRTCDFLGKDRTRSCSSSLDNPSCPLTPPLVDIDMDCRTKMSAWCYQVVDFCKFNRETVAIAMNLLDRFVASSSPASVAVMADRKSYQLAAMTCLYTAVKIHEPEAMDPRLVSTLSRGTYQPHEVEAMERQILTALTWRVNPPTAMAFVRQYLALIPDTVLDPITRAAIYDLAKFQTELAVSEYDFLNVKPSVVSFCSLMNALESVGCLPEVVFQTIASTLSHAIQLSANVSDIQMWLYQAVVREPAAQTMFAATAIPATQQEQQTTKSALERPVSCEVSPRSIAA